MEDYAVALVDEAGNPQYVRRRFTVAYLARIVLNA
jgi:putative NADH-flavin reductase